ncbi:MAG: hypothetical protein MUP41_07855 [Desulfobacterales bacterium]|nr:hypothetical protein [Desulfobacterales bacterium]
MTKRQSLKGKGADIFTSGAEVIPSHQPTITPAKRPAGKMGRPVKSTFYLSKNAADKLEDVWVDLRRANRKLGISKSDIVSKALEKTLEQLKKEPKDKIVGFFKGE